MTDDEFGLDYQIFILRKMIEELPPPMEVLFSDQLDKIVQSLQQRNKLVQEVKAAITTGLEDISLNTTILEFDRAATKNERDELQAQLDKLC